MVNGFFELERVFKFALEIAVGGKCESLRCFSRGVEREKLVRHVFEGFAHARFARVPARAAEFVERGMRAFDDAIALHQIHALKRNIETRIVSVTEQHELAAMAVRFDLAKPFELADAMIHVNDEVAGLQFGKVSEESGSANLVAGALDCRSDVEKIGVAENRELRFWKSDAFGKRRANQEQTGSFQRALRRETGCGVFRFTEHVGHFVFAGDVREALKFARAGGSEENLPARTELRLHVAHAGHDITMKARAGSGREFELWSRSNVDGELLEMGL